MHYQVEFLSSTFNSVMVSEGMTLSQSLTVLNSPVLFGCRTGICGTCLVQVEAGLNELTPPNEVEKEALDVYAPGNASARLACQIQLNTDIILQKIESA